MSAYEILAIVFSVLGIITALLIELIKAKK